MDSLKGTLTPMKVLSGRLNGGIAYGTFNYNELENKPSVNGRELVGNVNIPIPTKTSDLTNDSGFITSANVPTKTSDLTNDSGFITDADIPTKTSELTNDSGFITSADIPTIPTNTSQLNNDSGFLTMNTTPVRSVNSQTGDVNLFIPNATSQLNNDAGFVKLQDLSADNIPYDSENSISEKIDDNAQAIGDLSNLDTTDKSSLVEAVNEVNSSLTNATTETSGTITATSGYTVRMQNLVKINGTVLGNFTISSTGTITSRATIGNIPEGFRPYVNTAYLAPASSGVNYYQNRATNVIITTSGDIIVGDIVLPSGQNIKEISLTFAYNQGN